MTDTPLYKIKLETDDGVTDTLFLPFIPTAGDAVIHDRVKYRIEDAPRMVGVVGVGRVTTSIIVLPATVEDRNARPKFLN